MVTPRAARSAANLSATSSPYGVARREPTMARARASSLVSAPRTWSAGGAVMAPSSAGYPSSPGLRHVSMVSRQYSGGAGAREASETIRRPAEPRGLN